MATRQPFSTGATPHRTATLRTIFFQAPGVDVRYASGVIDATYAYDGSNTGFPQRLRAGCLMARITSSKLWVPCKRTAVNDTGATADNFVVDNAAFFKVGDTIDVGGDTGLTITDIDYATNTITVGSSFTFADNDAVFASGDLAGAEIARAILAEPDEIDLIDRDTNTAVDMQTGKLCFAGPVDNEMVLGDLTAVLAATHYLNHIQWKNLQGQD